MKLIAKILIGLVALVAILLVVLMIWGGQVVKQAVNVAGPQVLGVPVTLEEASFSPLRGYISLKGLVVGNPEGFNTESLFDMRHLEVALDVRSLFSDTIIIHRIWVDTPQITYEVGLRRTNLGALLAGLESEKDPEAEEKKAVDEPGKSVVIRELKIVDTRMEVSATALGGRAVPIQLGTITLNDLGGPDQSVTQITAQVLKALVGAVGNAVAGAGDLLGDGLKAALGGVGALGGMALDGATAVTGAVGGGARVVTGAVGDGTRAVTGAVGSGLSRVGGLVGIGGDKASDADVQEGVVAEDSGTEEE